jgi:hypothetical protein
LLGARRRFLFSSVGYPQYQYYPQKKKGSQKKRHQMMTIFFGGFPDPQSRRV